MDRVFALWQAVNDAGNYVQSATEKDGTYTHAIGSTEDINTPLTPFHSDDAGNFWTSDSVRNIKTFGYSYKELADWNFTSTNDFQNSVRGYINTLYGPTSSSKTVSKRHMKRSADDSTLQTREKTTDPKEGEKSPPTSSDGKYNEYLANIRVSKDAIGGSFFVHIFLGDFNPDPATWTTEPNLVGTHTIFTSITPKENGNIQVSGVIPLTTALIDDIQAGSLKSLDTAEVEPYLKEKLQWRVTKVSSPLSLKPSKYENLLTCEIYKRAIILKCHLSTYPILRSRQSAPRLRNPLATRIFHNGGILRCMPLLLRGGRVGIVVVMLFELGKGESWNGWMGVTREREREF